MTIEGPDIRQLTRHLAECPPSFLEEPMQPSGQGGIHVQAVLSDLLTALGGPKLTPAEVELFRYADKDAVRSQRNRLRIALVSAWLFSHPEMRFQESAPSVRRYLVEDLESLARYVPVESFVHDPDRREELARLCLSALDRRPAGESAAQARNRLSALSTIERERVVAEARFAEERARKVREEMLEKQRAQAAANTYNNE